jgi:hypothetical protein
LVATNRAAPPLSHQLATCYESQRKAGPFGTWDCADQATFREQRNARCRRIPKYDRRIDQSSELADPKRLVSGGFPRWRPLIRRNKRHGVADGAGTARVAQRRSGAVGGWRAGANGTRPYTEWLARNCPPRGELLVAPVRLMRQQALLASVPPRKPIATPSASSRRSRKNLLWVQLSNSIENLRRVSPDLRYNLAHRAARLQATQGEPAE